MSKWNIEEAIENCGKGTSWYGNMIREQLEIAYHAGYQAAKMSAPLDNDEDRQLQEIQKIVEKIADLDHS